MATITLGDYGTAASVLTNTELSALASGSWCTASAAIDNASTGDTDSAVLADFELYFIYASAPDAAYGLPIALIPSLDGTNYADGGGATAPGPGLVVGVFDTRAVNTQQRVVMRDVLLPPGKFKVTVQNTSNVAFATTPSPAHLLRMRTHNILVA